MLYIIHLLKLSLFLLFFISNNLFAQNSLVERQTNETRKQYNTRVKEAKQRCKIIKKKGYTEDTHYGTGYFQYMTLIWMQSEKYQDSKNISRDLWKIEDKTETSQGKTSKEAISLAESKARTNVRDVELAQNLGNTYAARIEGGEHFVNGDGADITAELMEAKGAFKSIFAIELNMNKIISKFYIEDEKNKTATVTIVIALNLKDFEESMLKIKKEELKCKISKAKQNDINSFAALAKANLDSGNIMSALQFYYQAWIKAEEIDDSIFPDCCIIKPPYYYAKELNNTLDDITVVPCGDNKIQFYYKNKKIKIGYYKSEKDTTFTLDNSLPDTVNNIWIEYKYLNIHAEFNQLEEDNTNKNKGFKEPYLTVLNKKSIEQDAIQGAINKSQKLFKEAVEKASEKSFFDALQRYIFAFKVVENYLCIDWNTKKINVPQESYTAIQQILTQLVIKPDKEYNFKLAEASNKIVKANVYYINSTDQEIPLSNIPVSFLSAKGDIISKSRTKNSGEAEFNINNILSSEKTQIIKAEIDILDLIPETYPTELIKEFFGSLKKPNTHIIINSLPISIYFSINKDSLSEKTHILAHKIGAELLKKGCGCNITTDSIHYDWKVNIGVNPSVDNEDKPNYTYRSFISNSFLTDASGKPCFPILFSLEGDSYDNPKKAVEKAFNNNEGIKAAADEIFNYINK